MANDTEATIDCNQVDEPSAPLVIDTRKKAETKTRQTRAGTLSETETQVMRRVKECTGSAIERNRIIKNLADVDYTNIATALINEVVMGDLEKRIEAVATRAYKSGKKAAKLEANTHSTPPIAEEEEDMANIIIEQPSKAKGAGAVKPSPKLPERVVKPKKLYVNKPESPPPESTTVDESPARSHYDDI